MKKLFTLCAVMLCTASMAFAGDSYGIAVNGTTYYAGTLNPTPLDPSFQEFAVLGLSLNAGDQFQLWDPSGNDGKGAGWAVDLDNASVAGMTRDGNHYVCANAGCYDFYIKLKYENDQLYIGAGECGSPTGTPISGGGGGQGGEGGGGQDPTGRSFYAIGWINGADSGEAAYTVFDDKYKFEDGKLAIECTMGSYIAIKDDMGNYYYSKKKTTIEDMKVTMEWANGWAGCEKWSIPEGTNYIIIRSVSFQGNIVLERVDKATFDAYFLDIDSQGIETPVIDMKAHKVFIDGQLRIIRGNKMFDATGREL